MLLLLVGAAGAGRPCWQSCGVVGADTRWRCSSAHKERSGVVTNSIIFSTVKGSLLKTQMYSLAPIRGHGSINRYTFF